MSERLYLLKPDVITRACRALGVAPHEFAHRCGISERTMTRALNGGKVFFATAKSIAEKCGVPVYELVVNPASTEIANQSFEKMLEVMFRIAVPFDDFDDGIQLIGFITFLEELLKSVKEIVYRSIRRGSVEVSLGLPDPLHLFMLARLFKPTYQPCDHRAHVIFAAEGRDWLQSATAPWWARLSRVHESIKWERRGLLLRELSAVNSFITASHLLDLFGGEFTKGLGIISQPMDYELGLNGIFGIDPRAVVAIQAPGDVAPIPVIHKHGPSPGQQRPNEGGGPPLHPELSQDSEPKKNEHRSDK